MRRALLGVSLLLVLALVAWALWPDDTPTPAPEGQLSKPISVTRAGEALAETRADDHALPAEVVERRLPEGDAWATVDLVSEDGASVRELRVQAVNRDTPWRDGKPEGATWRVGPLVHGETTFQVTWPDGHRLDHKHDIARGENTVTIRLPRRLFISGRVLDFRGDPAPRADVTAYRDGQGIGTRVRADGTFTIDVKDEGPFQLSARADELGSARLDGVRAPASNLELRLPRGAGLEVNVRLNGKPFPDAGVEFDNPRRNPPGPEAIRSLGNGKVEHWWGKTDANGQLTRWGMGAWTWGVSVRVDGYQLASERVELKDDVLSRVTLVLKKGAQLSGTVVDANGQPVEGASVWAMLPGHEISLRNLPPWRTGSDASGHFTLDGLAPGERYVVGASRKDALAPEVTVTASASGLELVLAGLPVVRGRVVDAAGKPVPSFTLNHRELSSPDGRFEKQLNAKETHLWVAAPGFDTLVVDVAGRGDVGDVVLKSKLNVTGRVFTGAGGPAAGARVSAGFVRKTVGSGPERIESIASTTTAKDGTFSLAGEVSYPTTVQAQLDSESGTVEVTGPGTIEIRMGGPGVVEGTQYDLRGKPLGGTVEVLSADARHPSFTADASGRFSGKLPRGSYQLRSAEGVLSGGFVVGAEPARVTVGNTPGECSVRVRGLTGTSWAFTMLKDPRDVSYFLDQVSADVGVATNLDCNEKYTLVVSHGMGPDRVLPVKQTPPLTELEAPK